MIRDWNAMFGCRVATIVDICLEGPEHGIPLIPDCLDLRSEISMDLVMARHVVDAMAADIFTEQISGVGPLASPHAESIHLPGMGKQLGRFGRRLANCAPTGPGNLRGR